MSMKITLDVKALVIGFLVGVFFVYVLGINRSGSYADFGVAIPSGGSAIVKTDNGDAYFINGSTGQATVISMPGQPKRQLELY